jgi:hypothetical protein
MAAAACLVATSPRFHPQQSSRACTRNALFCQSIGFVIALHSSYARLLQRNSFSERRGTRHHVRAWSLLQSPDCCHLLTEIIGLWGVPTIGRRRVETCTLRCWDLLALVSLYLYPGMGKAKKTRKFAEVKRVLNPKSLKCASPAPAHRPA